MPKSLAALPRALMVPASCGVALAVLAGQAMAQTPPRYTAKNLPKVTAARGCGAPAGLNEAGDVSLSCTYSLPSYTTTVKTCYEYLGNICFSSKTTVKPSYQAPAVWPAGSTIARPLTTSSLSYSTGAVTLGGTVVGLSGKIDNKGQSLEVISAPFQWLPPYSAAGQPLPVPVALQGTPVQTLRDVLLDGGTWWTNLGGTQHTLAAAGGQVWRVPELPATSDPAETASEQIVLAVQDGQQAVRSRWLSTTLTNGQQSLRHELWYVRGTEAFRIPLPVSNVRVDGAAITRNGRVLFQQGFTSLVWSVNQPLTTSAVGSGGNLNGTEGASRINASGLLGGSAPIPNDSQSRSKARIWFQGQGYDLQGLTSGLPSGWQLRTVDAMNDRGQLVVTAQDTSAFGGGASKTLLLTPQ
ncbi:MAG: hypothetical protein RI907_3272 [Pseudomonadota bacterium]|jgi:hypothetical protein